MVVGRCMVFIDYTKSFAPVVKYITLRIFLAIAAVYDMYVHQPDVESAFIYAPLRKAVYTHPLPEIRIPRDYRVKLLKSIYDLKQSPQNWNVHLQEYITSIGLRRSQLNHCLYILRLCLTRLSLISIRSSRSKIWVWLTSSSIF